MWFKWVLVGLFVIQGINGVGKAANSTVLNKPQAVLAAVISAAVDGMLIAGTLHYWGA